MEFFPLKNNVSFSEIKNISDNFSEHVDQEFSSISEFGTDLDCTLTFFDGSKYTGDVFQNLKSIILVSRQSQKIIQDHFPASQLVVVSDPRSIFIEIIGQCQSRGILGYSSALPAEPIVSSDVDLGKNTVIESGVQIDECVTIGSGAVIKSGTWLKKNVVIGENTVIGGTGINLHIGSKEGKRRRFPHIAGVIVEKGASLGANCVLVRGTLRSTRIGADTIIGNLCNIGHCVSVGDRSWMSSGVVVGGYCSIGIQANVGVGAVIKNGVSIGRNTNVGMGAVVIKPVTNGVSVFGNPAKKVGPIKSGPN